MNTFSDIGTKLASLRTQANLTIPELANRIGVKEVTLHNLESGKFAKIELIYSILNILGYEMTFTPSVSIAPKSKHLSDNLIRFLKSEHSDMEVALASYCQQAKGTDFSDYAETKKRSFVSHNESNYLLNDLSEIEKTIQKDLSSIPFPAPEKHSFSFIDLFAGVGGFRLAMQSVGGKCVFSSEWDKAAQRTYYDNYGDYPFGDITKKEIKDCIPDGFDVLCAGFPCQPFSLAGKKQGFLNETQGTLFFDILQIIQEKKPKIIFLENVRNLVAHDDGKTFTIIQKAIKAEGYSFQYRIIDASPLVPQKRVRCYMVCVKDNQPFSFPTIEGPEIPLSAALEHDVPELYTISDSMWAGHQKRTERNLARGTGFTAFTADITKPAHTLVARYYKDGKECLIPQEGKNPRMLTPRECARLQGFPEEFILPESKTVAYKQMGNSVAVPVLKIIAQSIFNQLL